MQITQADMPRFRGKAFEEDGKWIWQVWVTSIGSNEDGFAMNSNNSFNTKEEAIEDMKIGIRLACELLQKKLGVPTGTYIDLQSNETLNWDKNKYN